MNRDEGPELGRRPAETETGYDEWGASAYRRPIASPNPVTQYFLTLKALLTQPTLFFRNLRRPVGMVAPLFFGIVTSWIGSALEYLWITGFGRFFQSRLSDVMHALEKTSEIDSSGQTEALLAMRERFMNWMFGVGSVLVDPFKSCAKILFLSFFVWVAARIFGNLLAHDENGQPIPEAEMRERFSYESAVAIIGFSMAASLFKGVPILGGLIAGTFAAVIAIIGARETYKVGGGRATVIALFPYLLLWGAILATMFAFLGGMLLLFLR
jgi:hypothetical protein